MGRKKITPEKEASILATYAQGLKLWEVEKIEEVSRKTIYDVLDRNGVPTRDRKNARIPKAVSQLSARMTAIELVLERIERSIGPVSIGDHLGFESPFMVVTGKRVPRSEVSDVQIELFDLHKNLKKEYTLLMIRRDNDGS